jgi:hypothetical protein
MGVRIQFLLLEMKSKIRYCSVSELTGQTCA